MKISRRFLLECHDGFVRTVRFIGNGDELLTVSADGTAKIWCAHTGKLRTNIAAHAGPICFAALCGDQSRFLTWSEDATAAVWSSSGGGLVRRFSGHKDEILFAALDGSGQVIVSSDMDFRVYLWDVAGNRSVMLTEGWMPCIVFSACGKRVLVGGQEGKAAIWDVRTGKQLVELKGHAAEVQCGAFMPDGRRVVTASGNNDSFPNDNTVRIWDVETGDQLSVLRGHNEAVYWVGVRPDGAQIASTGLDGSCMLWDLSAGAKCALDFHKYWAREAAYGMAGSVLVTVSRDTMIGLWDTASGALLAQTKGGQGRVETVDFSPQRLPSFATAGFDGTASIWDLSVADASVH